MRRAMIGSMAVAGAFALAGCGGDDGGDEGDVQAFCDKIVEIDDADDPFRAAAQDDIAGAADALEGLQSEFAELVELAPEEIRADVETSEQRLAEFAAEAREASSPNEFLKTATRFQAENPDFGEASQRIAEFTGENCSDPAQAQG